VANQPYAEKFVEWIENLDLSPNTLYGEPQLKLAFESDADLRRKCCVQDFEDEDDIGISKLSIRSLVNSFKYFYTNRRG